MRPCFHHDKRTFFHVFEFVRAHQRALGHLQRLGRIVFAAADRAGQHCSAAQRLGNNIRRFRGRGKTAGNRDLAVVLNDSGTFPAIVFFQLLIALDDADDGKPSASGSAVHHFRRLDRRHGAKFVTVEHNTVGKLPAVFIRHRKDFPVQLLDEQTDHEVSIGVFLRHDDKNGGLLLTKALCIHRRIKAQHLLHLRVQKRIEPGQRRTHDTCHSLIAGGQRRSRKPPRLMIRRQAVQQKLEVIFPLYAAGRHQFLDQLEHRYNMPFLWFGKLRNEQDDRCHQPFGSVIKEGVLTISSTTATVPLVFGSTGRGSSPICKSIMRVPGG